MSVRRDFTVLTERELRKLGRCSWETAYGMPWTRRCGRKLKPGSRLCREHAADFRQLYPHLQGPTNA